MIVLVPPTAASFSGEKSVAEFLRIHCQVVRRFKNRWTGRFERDGRAYYIKAHGPAGWKFVLDELLHLRRPQIGARAEWQALVALEQLGIPAATIVAFGEHGLPSPWQQSFLVTQEIPRSLSLETLCHGPHAPRPGSRFRRRLVRAVAHIARTLHQNGINHRDFYLCHFLLDISAGLESIQDLEPRLYLIDLHRAQKRRRVPRRWIAKDLAGLLFSAFEIGLTHREKLLFARIYTGKSFREFPRNDLLFWQTVGERAQRLQRKIQKRSANWRYQHAGTRSDELGNGSSFSRQTLRIASNPGGGNMDESRKSSLLTTRDLRAAGRFVPGGFRLRIQVERQTSEFISREVLRLIPGVRLVCRGEWNGRHVVAKLFLPQRGAGRRISREIRGVEALADANIPVPLLLARGTLCDDSRSRILLFEEIQNAVSLRTEIQRLASSEGLYPLLEQLVGLVARQHRAGILQSDLHLNNFLLRGNALFAVDGGTVTRNRSGDEVSHEAGLKNLALLLAQLPLSAVGLFADLHREYAVKRGVPCDSAARELLDRFVQNCRERRLRIILAKAMRDCSDFFRVQNGSLSGICRRKYDSLEMRSFLANPDDAIRRGRLLKNGRSTTVALVSIGGNDLVVKRYNIKSPRRVFRYLFNPTHAKRSWLNSHRLEALGIEHARAVAYAERRFGPVKRAAYFVAEYVSGTDARTVFAQSRNSEHASRDIVEQLMRLLDSLAAAQISHGDLKASNIVFRENTPMLIDLDGMRHHARSRRLHAARRNDVLRLLQNFRDSSPLYRQLAKEAAARTDSFQFGSRPVQFPQTLRRGRLRIWYRTDSPVPLVSEELLDVLEQSGTPDESRSEILKRDRRRSIFRISSGDRTVVIKSFPFTTLKDMWRWNRYAPAEARNAYLAQRRGIPTPAYYGMFRTRKAGLVDNCGVILEDLKDYVSLNELSHQGEAELLRGVPILEMLYRAGVNHMDPSPFNLLIHRDSQQPVILDWQYASFTDPRNEAQLVIQASHFLDYAHIGPGAEFWYRWTESLFFAARPATSLAKFQSAVQSAQGRRLRPRERARIVEAGRRAA